MRLLYAMVQTPLEQPPQQVESSSELAPDPLPLHLLTFSRTDALADLILQLEAYRPDQPMPALLSSFVHHTGLQLTDARAVRRAILLIGERVERLQTSLELTTPAHGEMGSRRFDALTAALLPVLEGTRHQVSDPEGLQPAMHRTAQDALQSLKQQQPAADTLEERWWEEAEAVVHLRLVPGYARLARQLNHLEDTPFSQLLLRSPALMAVLTALPGLLTIPLMVSTPMVLMLLAFIGYFAIHPLWLRLLSQPIQELAQWTGREGPLLDRLASPGPWPEQRFSIQAVMEDLMPILEGERLAGRGDEESLRAAVQRYFRQVTPHLPADHTFGPHYLERLQAYAEHRVVRKYAQFARSRASMTAHPLGVLLDHRKLTAAVVAFIGIPVALMVSRITPLPPAIEFPLAWLLFGWLGYMLPQWLPGTSPHRTFVQEALADQQALLAHRL